MGLEPEFIPGDWRHGVDPAAIEATARRGPGPRNQGGVCGPQRDLDGVTAAYPRCARRSTRAGHPALLMVDTISSLASIDYRHDEWGVDVTVGGSQKGLMLPPGLSFNAVSAKALEACKTSRLPRSYWSWEEMIRDNKTGFFPYTPATNLLYGLREALRDAVRGGAGQRVSAAPPPRRSHPPRGARVGAGDLLPEPRRIQPALTAVLMPEGHDEAAFRKLILERFDLSLGSGLGKVKGKVFRIGHLGEFNDLMLVGTLAASRWGWGSPPCRSHMAG